jgi:vacuolar protein sorting-associated protein 1
MFFLAGLFLPDEAFEQLMKELIKKIKDPATLCVREVGKELEQVLEQVLEHVTSSCNEIWRFQELKEKVKQEWMRLLRAKTKEAGEFVTNIVDMEGEVMADHQYSNIEKSNHTKEKTSGAAESSWLFSSLGTIKVSNAGDGDAPPAVGAEGKRPAAADPEDPRSDKRQRTRAGPVQLNELNEREKSQNKKLRMHIEKYFKIVRENITNSVPKAIMLKLVTSLSVEGLRHHLEESIDTDDDQVLADLMRESEEVSRKRKEVQERVKALKRAHQAIQEVGRRK